MTTTLFPAHIASMALGAVQGPQPSRYTVMTGTALELREKLKSTLYSNPDALDLLLQRGEDGCPITVIFDRQDLTSNIKGMIVGGNMLHTFDTPMAFELNDASGLRTKDGLRLGDEFNWEHTLFVEAHNAPVTLDVKNRKEGQKLTRLDFIPKPFDVVVMPGPGQVTLECGPDSYITLKPHGGCTTVVVPDRMANAAKLMCREPNTNEVVPYGITLPNGDVVKSKPAILQIGENLDIQPRWFAEVPAGTIDLRIDAGSGRNKASAATALPFGNEGFNINSPETIRTTADKARDYSRDKEDSRSR